MASLDLTQEELRAIESTRGRLFQLSNSIGSLKNDIYKSNPLPTPESLQASAFILQQNLASLQRLVAEHAELFQRVAVHPSTNFPGRTQEPVLTQLLRKKLEPDIETWAEQGRDAATAAGVTASASAPRRYNEDEDEDDEDGYRPEEEGEGARDPLGELWADVREALVRRVGEYVQTEDRDAYTAEERERGVEKVRTGLARNLDEDSDEEEDEEEDEDDEMPDADGSGQPRATGAGRGAAAPNRIEPEYLMWFAARGDTYLPSAIELASQVKTGIIAKTGAGR